MIPSRRTFITGLAATLAAPAIVRAASLMPVRGIVMDVPSIPVPQVWAFFDRRFYWVAGGNLIEFSDKDAPCPWSEEPACAPNMAHLLASGRF